MAGVSPRKMERPIAIFLLITAATWSFSLAIWFSTGLGWVPGTIFSYDFLFWGAIAASPIWLPTLSLRSISMPAKGVRLASFLVLTCFFAILGKFIAESVVFYRLDHSKPPLIFAANLFLFRLPFILSFGSTVLLGWLVWKDLRVWRPHRQPK
jgi:hypothetical protein